jgi:arylformamidase
MRLYDVTLSVSESLPFYPGDPRPGLSPWLSRDSGAEFDVSELRLGTHSGTHVDAPAHCIDGGAGVDTLPLGALCGPAFVLDLSARSASDGPIAAGELNAVPGACSRLLLRTHGGAAWRSAPVPGKLGLSQLAAHALIERGLVLVGIDRLSIAPADAELAVHRALLEAGIVIVEGLDLAGVRQGAYELYCLPLKLVGADGAPARAVLVERAATDTHE